MPRQKYVKYCPFCGVKMLDHGENEKKCPLCGCITSRQHSVAGPQMYYEKDLGRFADFLNTIEEFQGPPVEVGEGAGQAIPVRAVVLETGQVLFYSDALKKWLPILRKSVFGVECVRCRHFVPLDFVVLNCIETGSPVYCSECDDRMGK